MMQIIPVIDLLNGVVVHAKRGDRSAYAPIQSALTDSCQPHDISQALLELYPFNTLYIADIDAITSAGNNADVIETLASAHPNITFWVDNGVCNVNARILYAPQANIRAVLGSENIVNLQDYRAISYAINSRHVLSLDKLDNTQLGAPELHNTGLYWPIDVICMTLNDVGSHAGPDVARMQALQQLNLARKKPANLFAAGGVRNTADLLALKQLGVTGALVASALHNKEITAQQLSDFYSLDAA
jgi:phosphoribosylformimino-5-aminoimidazole carboxamide ribotide isomerase